MSLYSWRNKGLENIEFLFSPAAEVQKENMRLILFYCRYAKHIFALL